MRNTFGFKFIFTFAFLNAFLSMTPTISFSCEDAIQKPKRTYTLVNSSGEFYESSTPGKFGGYWRGKRKIYGRLDCRSAKSWIARGHYVKYRVFFANEKDAIDAGFRPCGICMKERSDP